MGGNTSKKNISRELRQEELDVLKANTTLNEEYIRAFYKDFIEKFPSGRMKKKEFINYFMKFTDPNMQSKETVDFIFTVFDTNADGSVDFSEFVLTCAMITKNELDSSLRLVFSILDTSGDGYISYDEMVNFADTAVGLVFNKEHLDADSIATAIFNMFELDKNQKLSKEQFIDGCKTHEDLANLFKNSLKH